MKKKKKKGIDWDNLSLIILIIGRVIIVLVFLTIVAFLCETSSEVKNSLCEDIGYTFYEGGFGEPKCYNLEGESVNVKKFCSGLLFERECQLIILQEEEAKKDE